MLFVIKKGTVIIMKIIINDEEKVRLDKYLIDKLEISRSKVQEMIKQKNVI